MNLLFLLFFSVINPFAWGAWIAALIAWFIPWEYLGLWIASIVSIWAIFLFPLILNRPYTVDVHLDFIGEWITYSTNLALFIGMGGVIVVRLCKNHHKYRERLSIDKEVQFISFSAYGILAACFGYLFLTNFWHNYQPVWQAYGVVFIGTFLIIITCWLLQTYRFKRQEIWIKDLFTSIYSSATK